MKVSKNYFLLVRLIGCEPVMGSKMNLKQLRVSERKAK